MAIYTADITVPPKTPYYAPVEIFIRPGVGFLRRASILFPAGSLGLIGIRLLDEDRQFAPLPSGWITDNDKEVSWSENRRLQGPPYRVKVQGYSNALDWPHTISIKLEVER